MIGKTKPSSPKKHKHLRRVRRTDWEQSRRDLAEREKIAETEAEKYLKEKNVNPGA